MDNNINIPNTNNNYEVSNNVPNVNSSFNQTINDNGYVVNAINNKNNKNNKNNVLPIIICLVIISVVVGFGFFFVKGLFKTSDKVLDDVAGETFDDKDETSLIDFSKYENYDFIMNITVVANNTEIKTSSSGVADVKNKTDYMETVINLSGYAQTSYSYSDYGLGYNYTSTDKKSWEVGNTSGTESINLKDLINKINNNIDVEVLGKGQYLVKIDYRDGDMSYDNVYANVYVSNGYISNISYDFTSLVASEGISKFTIDIQLSNFNKAGNVVIPDNVKNGTNSI